MIGTIRGIAIRGIAIGGLCVVAVVACAPATPRAESAAATAEPPRDAASSDAACKRWQEVIMTLEGAPNPIYAIDFAPNSDALSENAKIGIERTAALEMLKGERPRVRRFAVVGHADVNEPQDISERRAAVVMRALVARGIAADRMEIRSLGTAPVHGAPPGTNRLVTFMTLVDYRGGVRHWADGGFIECTADHAAPECRPTPEYEPKCIER